MMLPLCLSLPPTSVILHKTLTPKTPIFKTLAPKFILPKTLPLISKPLNCTSGVQVADLTEKDYSFLESGSDTQTQHSKIIAAAQISDKSKVLISFPTVGFVNRVTEEVKCELVVCVHESLFVLAMIKEGDDTVRCFQGGLDVVPNNFVPFDVVFACYFPGMGVGVEELIVLGKKLCVEGGRLVISFDQGRDIIEREHKKQYPDIATANLPDKTTLEKAAAKHSFEIAEFADEPDLYIAVLKLCK